MNVTTWVVLFTEAVATTDPVAGSTRSKPEETMESQSASGPSLMVKVSPAFVPFGTFQPIFTVTLVFCDAVVCTTLSEVTAPLIAAIANAPTIAGAGAACAAPEVIEAPIVTRPVIVSANAARVGLCMGCVL